MSLSSFSVFLAATSLLACTGGNGSGKRADGGVSDGGGGEDASDRPDASDGCTYQGFSPTTESAERDTELGVLFYTGSLGEAPNVENLTIDFYFPFGAIDSPHSLTFDGENLQDCHSCFLIRRNCGASSCISGQVFLVQEGTADFTSMGGVGERFQGSIQNAVLAEVTIGAQLKTTLVPGGETWCVDQFDIDALVTIP